MNCIYCGSKVVESYGNYVCSSCRRSYTEEQVENAKKGDDNKSDAKRHGITSLSSFLDSSEDNGPQKVITESEAKEEIKERLEGLDLAAIQKSRTQNAQKLAYDFKHYKKVDLKNKEMVNHLIRDFGYQTTKNTSLFVEMFKKYGKEVIQNFKENLFGKNHH